MFFSKKIFASSITLLLWGTIALARDLQAVYSLDSERSLEAKDIQQIIRANQLTWKNGQNILLIIDELELITDKEFQEAFGTSKTMFLNSWRIKFFSGRALSPLQVKSYQKGLSYIEENSNALFLTFKGLSKKEAPKNILIQSF